MGPSSLAAYQSNRVAASTHGKADARPAIGSDVVALMANYKHVQIIGRIDSPYTMSDETDIPIYVLRAVVTTMAEIEALRLNM